jgi:hypothetical protein
MSQLNVDNPTDQDKSRKESEIKCWYKDARWLVRAFGIAMLAVGYLVFRINPTCGNKGNSCPSYSFNDPLVLRFERGLIVILVLLILCAIFWEILRHGEFPDQISREGFKWSKNIKVSENLADSAAQQETAIKSLDTDVSKINRRVRRMDQRVQIVARDTFVSLEELYKRVSQLEGTDPKLEE